MDANDKKIHKHIKPMFGSLESASIEYFLTNGVINGSFYQRLKDMLNDKECEHPFEKVISAGALHNCTVCGKNINPSK